MDTAYILVLSRCDNITISPALLSELESIKEPLPRKLYPDMGGNTEPDHRGGHVTYMCYVVTATGLV